MNRLIPPVIAVSAVKRIIPETGRLKRTTSHPAAISPSTSPALSAAMKYPLIFSWSGREFTYDIAAATKSPAPSPSMHRRAITRTGAVESESRMPLARVRASPARITGTRPYRSDQIRRGGLIKTHPENMPRRWCPAKWIHWHIRAAPERWRLKAPLPQRSRY